MTEVRPLTYTATVGTENAAWLADRKYGPASVKRGGLHITDNGDGTVSFDYDAYLTLAGLGDDDDGAITDVEGTLTMWIAGDPYPVR